MTVRAIEVLPGDCREVLARMAADGVMVDSVVTDPPYHLTSIVKRFGKPGSAAAKSNGATGVYKRSAGGFMGKQWDGAADGTMVAFDPETWARVYAVMKPGAHLVAFGGTRGWHRMACAIEDAGFEVRDTIIWLYGSGFPKSHDVAKGIDAHHGVKGETVGVGEPAQRMRPGTDQHKTGDWEKLTDRTYQPGDYVPATAGGRRWDGWGTALKPAVEPIVLARKPLAETSVARNVLVHGAGALNVDGCRVETNETIRASRNVALGSAASGVYGQADKPGVFEGHADGRWPANVCHDGSPEVEAAFAAFGDKTTGTFSGHRNTPKTNGIYGDFASGEERGHVGDSGTASRFFYSAKADAEDRWGSKHPTVKPVALIRWLARLVTPPGGVLLDPFAGSGTAGVAALAEGFGAVLIEREDEYLADIAERLAHYRGDGRHSLAAKNRKREERGETPFFDRAAE